MQLPKAPSDFDPADSRFLGDNDEFFERARAQCPIFHDSAADAVIVTRYEDVRRIIEDHETFSSKFGSMEAPEAGSDLPTGAHMAAAVLLNTDPPRHTVVRKIMNRAFTRSRVAAMEPTAYEIADALIDEFIDAGSCDIMDQYAYPVSSQIVSELLGLPRADIPRFYEFAAALLALIRQNRQPGAPAPADADKVNAAVEAAWAYFGEVLADRRASPREDMTSTMLLAVDDDGRQILSDDEIIVQLLGIVSAGTETTANNIGATLEMLEENPDVRAQVIANPELTQDAVEEGLRRRPISQTAQRRSTREVEMGGFTIPADCTIAVSLASACNDGDVFEDPYAFKIDRDNIAQHVAFGRRAHFCIGAPLARMTARVALEVLYRRIPDLRIPEQELEYQPTRTPRVLRHMRAEWAPVAAHTL